MDPATCVHASVRARVRACVRAHLRMRVRSCVRVRTRSCVCVRTCARARTRVRVHARVRARVCVRMCMRAPPPLRTPPWGEIHYRCHFDINSHWKVTRYPAPDPGRLWHGQAVESFLHASRGRWQCPQETRPDRASCQMLGEGG